MAELLERPLYSTSEAARLLGLSTQTLRRWLEGYIARGVRYPPVIRPKSTSDDEVSWGEFVEAGFLREYRHLGVSLQRIRPFVEALREEFEVIYPLAHFRPAVDPDARELVMRLQQMTVLEEVHPAHQGAVGPDS
ncbi:MAG: helix-turn-helix domain-containing protein [Actinomycetota bacterium]|nr:helix-turn-helix domain-containing protein [Actinomycetota bacterium]